MRRVILYIAISLDGYIADLNGGVSWLDSGADAENTEDGYEAFLQKIDTVVMGYNTYRQVAEELSPGKWVYSGMMSYVLTHRKMDDLPEIRFVHQNVGRLLQRLKQQEGRDIWLCGGANVVGQCLEQDLIDELHITMIPILLGRGIPLFCTLDRSIHLKLISVKKNGNLLECIYRRAGNGQREESI